MCSVFAAIQVGLSGTGIAAQGGAATRVFSGCGAGSNEIQSKSFWQKVFRQKGFLRNGVRRCLSDIFLATCFRQRCFLTLETYRYCGIKM